MMANVCHGRGRPRITSRAGSALDQAEEALGLPPVRRETIDWRLARICNHFVTRAKLVPLGNDPIRIDSVYSRPRGTVNLTHYQPPHRFDNEHRRSA